MVIRKEWWIYTGEDVVPSASAPKWLVDEYNEYNNTAIKWNQMITLLTTDQDQSTPSLTD